MSIKDEINYNLVVIIKKGKRNIVSFAECLAVGESSYLLFDIHRYTSPVSDLFAVCSDMPVYT